MRYCFPTALLILAALAPPAHAQFSSGKEKTPLDYVYERQDREQKENEQQYNEQMKRLKAQKPSATNSDPWKGVRSGGDSSPKR